MAQQLHKDVQEIYNFEPHKISSKEKEEKSKRMDLFWEKVTKNKKESLEELKIELRDSTNSSFFLYDGGNLLLSLTESKEDNQIALDAMSRVNLKDINLADYVRSMNYFALKGFNTTNAALKIISLDTFVAYIPQHAMELGKGLALRFMLLPINSSLYIQKTIDALATAKDTDSKKHLLNFLLYTNTCEGDSIILKYASDKNQSQDVTNYAASLAKMNNVKRQSDPSAYSTLVLERRQILSRISDEALDELNDLTRKMKEKYECH